jgi:hypothetical protein
MLLFAKEEYANISKNKSQVMVSSLLARVQNTQQRYVPQKCCIKTFSLMIQSIPFIVKGSVQQKVFTKAGYSL